jgi:hypothetical protein
MEVDELLIRSSDATMDEGSGCSGVGSRASSEKSSIDE